MKKVEEPITPSSTWQCNTCADAPTFDHSGMMTHLREVHPLYKDRIVWVVQQAVDLATADRSNEIVQLRAQLEQTEDARDMADSALSTLRAERDKLKEHVESITLGAFDGMQALAKDMASCATLNASAISCASVRRSIFCWRSSAMATWFSSEYEYIEHPKSKVVRAALDKYWKQTQ